MIYPYICETVIWMTLRQLFLLSGHGSMDFPLITWIRWWRDQWCWCWCSSIPCWGRRLFRQQCWRTWCCRVGLADSPVGKKADLTHGPLTRYIKLWVAHAPGMPGTFSPPPRVSNPDMHHGTCVTHVPWCMPGSLTSGLVWCRWRGKRSRHSRRMPHPQFYISGKRSMMASWYADAFNITQGLYYIEVRDKVNSFEDREGRRWNLWVPDFQISCNKLTWKQRKILQIDREQSIKQTLNSQNTVHLALRGDLWRVYCEDLGENWPRYNGITLW